MKASPLAGKPAEASMLVNVPRLVTAYYTEEPDSSVPEQRVAFGTSGHRGSAFDRAFNERHILAITQAICLYRKKQRIDGPLFLGMDTHALSEPALATRARGAGRQRRRGDARATATNTPRPRPSPARFSRTTAGARPGSRTASSSRPRTIRRTTAASSTTRRTADPPESARHRMDRGAGERAPRECSQGREEDPLREGSPCPHDAPARLPRSLRRRSRQRDRHGRHSWRARSAWGSIRSAGPGSTTGGRSPSATGWTSRS